RRVLTQLSESRLPHETGLSVTPTGTQSVVWWGMVGLLVMYASSFGALFYSYFYVRLFSDTWPQEDLPRPALLLPAVVYGLLLLAGVFQVWAARSYAPRRTVAARIGLLGAILSGAAFVAGKLFLLWQTEFTPWTNAYGSLFYV